ncbi:MAG: hypothetical protein DWQ29_03410 [Planctomycetota bacterium]|nr:MAG: hypothetical protein DWQ29_03410 [Planctomycetota bacterium]
MIHQELHDTDTEHPARATGRNPIGGEWKLSGEAAASMSCGRQPAEFKRARKLSRERGDSNLPAGTVLSNADSWSLDCSGYAAQRW